MKKKVIIYTFFITVVIIIMQYHAIANNPPEKPSIEGPNIARIGKICQFTLYSEDPECDKVGFNICGWGDDSLCNYSIGLFPSGEKVSISHKWGEAGSYTLRLCAVDCYGACSEFATYNIKIVKTRLDIVINHILEQCPLLQKLIR